MTSRIINNRGASVRARLLGHAKQRGIDFQHVLSRYAIERLLFRLSQTSDGDRYVLKGAMLFVTWPEHVFRPTYDLDLLGQGDPSPAVISEVFTRVCQVEVCDDGLRFDPAGLQVQTLREADKYQGVRLRLNAELAGAIIPVQVDIGFGDLVYPQPKRSDFPGLLPELPPASILMYPPETVVAEKFEAMIRFGETNGRIKDFYDIWVAIRTFRFDLSNVVEAISGTLKRRETTFPLDTPFGLTAKFAANAESRLWAGFLRRNPPKLMPPSFAELQAELRRFFGPVIASLAAPEAARGRWDPVGGTWR